MAPTPIEATLPESRSSESALYAPSTSALRLSRSAASLAVLKYSSGSWTEARRESYLPSSSLPCSKHSLMPSYEITWGQFN